MGLILGWKNHADTATVIYSSFSASFPIANALKPPVKKVARSTSFNSTGSYWLLEVDLGSPKFVDLVGLIGTNLEAGARYQIYAGSTTPVTTASMLYDSGQIYVGSAKTPNLVHPCGGARARYWGVNIWGATRTIDVGRLFIGESFNPDAGIDWGGQFGYESTTQVQSSLSGVDYFDKRPLRRVKPVRWSWLTELEAYRGFIDIQRNCDISGEILVADDELNMPDLAGGQWSNSNVWQLEGATKASSVASIYTPTGRGSPMTLSSSGTDITLHGLQAAFPGEGNGGSYSILCAVRKNNRNRHIALRLSQSSQYVDAARVVFDYTYGMIGGISAPSGWKIHTPVVKALRDGWFLFGMICDLPAKTSPTLYASMNLMEGSGGADQYKSSIGHTVYYSGLSVFKGRRSLLYPGIEQDETFLARLRQITPLENPYLDTHSVAFDLIECV